MTKNVNRIFAFSGGSLNNCILPAVRSIFLCKYDISGERPAAKAVPVTVFCFFFSSAIEIIFFI